MLDKIKDKIKIGGFDYKYIEEENLTRDYGNLGQSCANNLTIIVDKSMPEQQKESTLIHEILEQINCNYELSLNHSQICTLETALYQVYKDNFKNKYEEILKGTTV